MRLLRRNEFSSNWNPVTAKRLTAWEVTQRLIRALQEHGDTGAAAILDHVGAYGEVARDLAYRLYTMCERKKWADEALAYNSLVVEWSDISGAGGAAEADDGGASTPVLIDLRQKWQLTTIDRG